MRMDIERAGAEVDALRGSHATIREGRPAMLVEVHKDVLLSDGGVAPSA
jgi:hypothetical protein